MSEADPDLHRAWRAMDAGDYEESARLFGPFAARGSETALNSLGWMYNNGHLGPRDSAKAMSLWEQALAGGSNAARVYLGRALIETGDPQRARALFLEDADQGHKPSLYWAGRMSVRGQGGERDEDAGVALLTRAAAGGHIFARRDLLRLEIRDARSWLGRLWAYCKVVSNALAVIPNIFRDPHISDDLR